MKVLSVSAYDDYVDDVVVKNDGEGLFSPFTFLCFALILFLSGLLCLFSASMDKAISEGFPFWHYFFEQLFGAAIGAFIGVIAVFTPEKVLKRLHFVTLPLSLILMGLSFFGENLVWLRPSSGALYCLSICFFAPWAVSFVKSKERKGFPLLLIVPLTIVTMLITGAVCGLAWYILALLIILASASSYRVGKGYLFYIALCGCVFFAFLIVSYPSSFASVANSIFPVSDPKFYDSNLIASSMAINDGGISGVGLGKGLYKLGLIFQPEGEFIFATVYEELGLLGLALIIIPLLMILVVGIRTVNRAERKGEESTAQLTIALTVLFVFPFILNLLHTIGFNPFGGALLPLFSYSPIYEGINVFVLVLLYRNIHKIGRKGDEKK